MTKPKKPHNETPYRRVLSSGRAVWVARYTAPDGRRLSAGVFETKTAAQKAINQAYDKAEKQAADQLNPLTVDGYFQHWLRLHPRSERSMEAYEHRIGRVLEVKLEGKPLRAWNIPDLRRRHMNELLDHLLRQQGRSASGATNILRALSSFFEDAIDDQITDNNPAKGARLSRSDPRVTKSSRPVRVFSIDEMHRFAAASSRYEAMLRVFTDCGLRLGEVLPLTRADYHDGLLEVRKTAFNGEVLPGTKHDHHQPNAGRVVPVPPGLQALLRDRPPRIDTPLLFPTPTGKMWRNRNFYSDVWYPTRQAVSSDIRPHECRHSWISHLNAAGLDPAHIAAIAGHTVETMNRTYRHAVGESYDAVRRVFG